MTKAPPHKIKLNELTLQRLKPKARPYLVWDTLQHGLAILVQPSGNKAWKCIYSRHGRPRWYTLGRADAIGLSDARKLAGKIMVRVAEGEDPQADRRAERSAGTFEELAAKYRAYAMKKNKSWKQADALVQRLLLPRWAKLKVTDIKRGDVKALMAGIAAPITANSALASASAIFTWGLKEELIQAGYAHPCIGVERNKTNERERILFDSEIPAFWAEFDNYLEGPALKVLLLTGQRPGEVTHMRTEHIKSGWWEMPGQPVPALDWPGTKNGNTHQVWLPKAAQEIITQMEATGLVFTGPRGGPMASLDIAMRGICKKLGVERATPHDLRRTHGSKTAKLFNREVMNRIENHREGGIADVYDRNEYAEENQKAMETVASAFMALIEGEADNVIPYRKA